MTQRQRIWAAVAVFTAFIAAYYPISPGGSQMRHMASANAHIPYVLAHVLGDSRFKRVGFCSFTGLGGSLMVYGEVSTQADLDAIHSLVNQSRPPVPVRFAVVCGPPATQAAN